jgi:hypothetical protein
MKANRDKSKAKYRVIVKAGQDRFLKYSYVNNVYNLSIWLNKNFPDWLWLNVYDFNTGVLLKNFTKALPPQKYIKI